MKPSVPFGIVSLKHTWPKNPEYTEQNFALTIDYEPKLESAYFWAQQFWFHQGDGGYWGIQSDGDINGTRQKIAIFSIWKAIDAINSTIEGSSAETFGHEGTGYSCKIPFNWDEGKLYKLRLLKIIPTNDDESVFWEASIVDMLDNKTFTIGRIAIPKNWGNLQEHSNFFVEYFRPINSCEETPYEKAIYSTPIMIEKIQVHPDNCIHESYGACASIGQISENVDGGFIIETGKKMI